MLLVALAVITGITCGLRAATYEVGPSQKLATIGEVPWESLQPGDTVLIHARLEPYREKFVICRAGTEVAPITVRGVPDAAGNLPVLDGDHATTRTNMNFWGDVRGVIKIGGANVPADTMPAHIVLENLDVRGARPPFGFVAANGETKSYKKNASAIYVEKCEHLIIRNCRLHDSGNGLFVSSNDERASRDLLVEHCKIFDNGIEKSGLEHNVYTEAIGAVFQYNHFGPLRAGCFGNSLKDRSAGLVVRYNWFEGGNKTVDIVEAQDSALVRKDSCYRDAFVYGNVLIKQPKDVHSYVVHYGGDSGIPINYRKGTLWFFNNTVVYLKREPVVVVRLSSDGERCEFHNNIVYTISSGKFLNLCESKGTVTASHNWFKRGWKSSSGKTSSGTMIDAGSNLTGEEPGFVDFASQDFHLTASSPCRKAGKHIVTKAVDGTTHQTDDQPDLGAFAFPRPDSRPNQSSPRAVRSSSSKPR